MAEKKNASEGFVLVVAAGFTVGGIVVAQLFTRRVGKDANGKYIPTPGRISFFGAELPSLVKDCATALKDMAAAPAK